MPRYIIRDITGAIINRIIAPADQVGAFCDKGDTFETEAMEDFTAERIARFAAADARRYLAETDWYVMRALDPTSATPVPTDIAQARAAARQVASLDPAGDQAALLLTPLLREAIAALPPAPPPALAPTLLPADQTKG